MKNVLIKIRALWTASRHRNGSKQNIYRWLSAEWRQSWSAATLIADRKTPNKWTKFVSYKMKSWWLCVASAARSLRGGKPKQKQPSADMMTHGHGGNLPASSKCSTVPVVQPQSDLLYISGWDLQGMQKSSLLPVWLATWELQLKHAIWCLKEEKNDSFSFQPQHILHGAP